MSNPNETTEEAIAALHRYADFAQKYSGEITVGHDALREYADRIEAAAERERVKARHDADAMREALGEILERTNREKARDYDAALNSGILEIHDIANTAINETKGE